MTQQWKPTSLADWKRRSLMEVTLPSGAQVTVKTLSLDELAAQDGLSDDLLRVVLLEQTPGGFAAEITRSLQRGKQAGLADAKKLSDASRQLRDRLVLASVVAPKLTAKDLDQLDGADKEMIAELATRARNVDAAGKQVGADSLGFFRLTCQVLGRTEADPARKALLMELAELQ